MTVAERAIEKLPKVVIGYLVLGGILALLLIGFGYHLTQKQLDLDHTKALLGVEKNSEISELTVKLATDSLKLRSTYPGLVLIVCGTAMGILIVRKKFEFHTRHTLKDGEKEAGGTDIVC